MRLDMFINNYKMQVIPCKKTCQLLTLCSFTEQIGSR